MIYLILTAFFVLADILSKYIVTAKMSVGQSIPLWEKVFHLTYVRNTGAAFSMLEGQRIFLIAVPIIVILAVIIYTIVKKPKSKLLMLSFAMIISGGIGNLIDRIRFGYVIDFLDFRLINFPVFNVADIWVTLGAALFVCLLLFSKEDTI
ncbi:MAG: signal peptidase II [Clostridia bacterium]|nr:signal peptidase II [Clostridia bacterium]